MPKTPTWLIILRFLPVVSSLVDDIVSEISKTRIQSREDEQMKSLGFSKIYQGPTSEIPDPLKTYVAIPRPSQVDAAATDDRSNDENDYYDREVVT